MGNGGREPGGWRLCGVVLLEEAGGIPPTAVPLSSGVDVLYGLNGAGKSRLLDLVRAGLSGEPWRGAGPYIQVEVTDWSADEPLIHEIRGLLTQEVQDAFRFVPDLIPKLLGGLWMDENEDLSDRSPDRWIARLLEGGFSDGLAVAIANQGCIMLEARGDGNALVHVGFKPAELEHRISALRASYKEGHFEDLTAQAANLRSMEDVEGLDDPDAFDKRFNKYFLLSGFEAVRLLTDEPRLDAEEEVCLLAQAHLEEELPAWTALPIYELGIVDVGKYAWATTPSDEDAIHDLLLRRVRESVADEPMFTAGPDQQVGLRSDVVRELEEVGSTATEYARMLLPSAPCLELIVSDPGSILSGRPIRAQIRDTASDKRIDVAYASHAERQALLLGLELALLQRERPAGAVLLDEPDRALHPHARRLLAEGLPRLAEELRLPILVATHAPELIAATGVRPWHIRRSVTGAVTLSPLDRPSLARVDALRDLGLDRADALQLCRLLVVVEGKHDLAVLRSFCGDTLTAAGAQMVMMAGTRNLASLLDCQVFFTFSDADALIVLDHLHHDLIATSWEEATREAQRGALWAGLDRLERLLHRRDLRGAERSTIEFLKAALGSGYAHRIHLFGLDKYDVIMYLAVDRFIPGFQGSWEQLRKEKLRRDRVTDFKDWLRDKYGAQINVRTVAQVAADVDEIPLEFERLIEEIRLLSHVAVPRGST